LGIERKSVINLLKKLVMNKTERILALTERLEDYNTNVLKHAVEHLYGIVNTVNNIEETLSKEDKAIIIDRIANIRQELNLLSQDIRHITMSAIRESK
jgi:HEAT repeat protein